MEKRTRMNKDVIEVLISDEEHIKNLEVWEEMSKDLERKLHLKTKHYDFVRYRKQIGMSWMRNLAKERELHDRQIAWKRRTRC